MTNDPLPTFQRTTLGERLMLSDAELKQQLEELKSYLPVLEARVVESAKEAAAAKEALAGHRKMFERMEGLILDGGKALALLNSAGVAAMLAFSQALVAKELFDEFKPFALWSLGLFLVGAFTSSLVAVAIAINVVQAALKENRHTYHFSFITIATATFFAGAVVFMVGMARTF